MIDWGRIAELRREIGHDDFDEVTALFLSEVLGAIGALGRPRQAPMRVAEQMHALKGAAMNLGFAALADLCRAGERAAASGDVSAVRAGELRRVFDASLAEFESQRGVRFAA